MTKDNKDMDYTLDIKNFSTYSKEMGMLSVEDIISSEGVKKSGVAFLTDDSTLSGVPEFIEKCSKNNIKPIFGVVFNLFDKKYFEEMGEITLYAKNENGYRNLKKLVSKLEKSENKFLLDKDLLKDFSEGIVALTGGSNSVLGINIINKDDNFIYTYLSALKNIYGKNIYLELQQKKHEKDDFIRKKIYEISEKTNFNILTSNDNRFSNKNHYELLIEKGKRVLGVNSDHTVLDKINKEDFQRTQNQNFGFYFKNDRASLLNTQNFINNFDKIDVLYKDVIMPKTGDNKSLREILREKYQFFIKDIPREKRELYKKRIKEELEIIEELGFDNYFLIFDNIINKNKDKVGFALRGSSVGSLVVHILGLSDIDPIENGLLFERFLNRGRGTRHELPDIDLETTNTDTVFEYIKNNYGEQNVAMLMAHTKAKTKTQLSLAYDVLKNYYKKDLNNYFEKDFKELKNIFSKSYGSDSRSIDEEIKINYKLRNFIKNNRNASMILNIAKIFENQILGQKRSNASVVINNNDITDIFSIKKDDAFTISNIIETSKEYVEKLGLIKLDILSNIYLKKALNAYEDLGLEWREKGEKYKSKEVYDLLNKGMTVSINQLKSEKQAQLCKEVGVDKFSDLVAVVALLRPGVDLKDRELFIERKKNANNIKYTHPLMEEILGETYGVVVYDEQVMKIVQKIGNFTPEESDEFRSAIKKNKIDFIKSVKNKFIEGASVNNIDVKVANDIFNSLESISGKYTFTKAHATVYSDLIYKQIWLKANYPAEYIKHYLLEDKKELNEYVAELENRGIHVLQANVNRTESEFKTLKSKSGQIGVDFAFNYILKNEDEFVKAIIKEREKNGKFENIFDFMERIVPEYTGLSLFSPEWQKNEILKNQLVDKIKKMIYAGAFDAIAPEKELYYMRNVFLSSLDEGLSNVLKPYLNSNYEYILPKEDDSLTHESIENNEELLYGFSPTKRKRMLYEVSEKKISYNMSNSI